ncbi:hypothetical protein G6F68_016666 [Rhizopus microsporus]|nr:hypothetical protein G6F68_016666 [Rhizopus microsporus]
MTGPVRQSKRIRNESVEEQPSKMSKSNKDSQPVRINALGITNESIDDHLENIQASLDDQTNVQEEFIEVQSEPAQYMEQEEIQVFDDNKAKDTEAQFNNVTIEDAQPTSQTRCMIHQDQSTLDPTIWPIDQQTILKQSINSRLSQQKA